MMAAFRAPACEGTEPAADGHHADLSTTRRDIPEPSWRDRARAFRNFLTCITSSQLAALSPRGRAVTPAHSIPIGVRGELPSAVICPVRH